MIRSVLGVLAGIVALTAASFAIEAVANPLLMRMFPAALPNEAALNLNVPVKLFTFLYSSLCVAGGGYVTAWVAKRSPVVHAVIMGAIQTGLTVWAMREFPQQAPRWIWFLGIVLTVPMAWLGGMLRAKQGKTEPF